MRVLRKAGETSPNRNEDVAGVERLLYCPLAVTGPDGLLLPVQSLVSVVLTCLQLLFCSYKLRVFCVHTGVAAYFTCEYMHSLSRELFPNICATDSFGAHSHRVEAHRTTCAPEAAPGC